MLGTKDVTMYILAAKSLLSFADGLAIVVHSDGSLTDADQRRVARHIDGVRFVRYQEADARAAVALRDSPFLSGWREADAAYRRLIDVELWRQTARVIVLDSDVLTHGRPEEVIAWLRGGTRGFLLGQAPTPQPGPTVPQPNEHVQASFLRRVDEISASLGLTNRFLQGTTAGFCGYFDEISLDRVESVLRTALGLGLPMRQWGGDQCLVIYLLSVGKADRLPDRQYINFEPSLAATAIAAKIIHFYGTHRFHGAVYPRLAAAAVRRLSGPTAT